MNGNQKTTQAVVSDQPAPQGNQTLEKFALFMEDGTSLVDVLADLESRLFAIENP